MALRKKIVQLAKMIGGLPGMVNKIDENAPEYYSLECVVTDDMADVALAAGLRKARTIAYLAEKSGKSLDETTRLAHQLGETGVFTIWKDKTDGLERCYVEIFAPGILERMVGNREQLAKFPQIARAFDEYTKKSAAKMGAMLPDGSSLMRVIPIESAIDGNPKAVPYEKLSYYLDKYDTFSVSDCSCRASRRIMGEGCGHLEQDMCLHLGSAAEYYAETGKARYVTREEAEEILKRAEDNGLMHSMPNIDELGESGAICNCCSCSCFGLRIGLMFGAKDAIRSNYVAEVDEEKCVACAQCVENCPGNALKLGQKLCSKESLEEKPTYKKIKESTWGPKDWNVDYRENREDTVATGTAPCKTACPAHIAVQGYLRLAAQGKYTDALELIKKENPFPAVCGRICNHRCETECTRGSVDEAVAIDEVKRFIADHDLRAETRFVPPMINQIGKPYEEKIAIVGAGPAGMTCAYFLAAKGYRPTVFDKAGRPGGMMMNAIPSFRLEKDVVQAEINILEEMGVEFKCGVEVGKDVTIKELREQGYKGFYIAIGLQSGGALNILGEDAEGVMPGIEFIKKVNLEGGQKLHGNVVVIGGGSIGADVARTAVRCGPQKVSLYCLESYEEMPMGEEDRSECERDGIDIHAGWGQTAITAKDGKAAGISFRKCTSVKDAWGHFAPQFDDSVTETADCDFVLYCIGQRPELNDLLAGTKVTFNANKTIKADPLTYQTEDADIFVGGDIYTGQKFVIDAIAAGKEAAISLHRHVHEGQSLTLGRDRRHYVALNKDAALISPADVDRGPRQIPGYNEAKARTFGDARMSFTEEQIRKETARCLSCGATKVDEYLCIGCGQCTTRCKFDAIHLVKKHDMWGGSFEALPIAVAKHVVKRSANIAANAVKGRRRG